MDPDLQLDAIPDLPQRPLLIELARDLWRDPDVLAVCLGGSLARGAGDAYSDVDLRVAVRPAAFDPEQLPRAAGRLAQQVVVRVSWSLGEGAVLHHLLLADSQIYDLCVQTPEREPGAELRLVLGCRDPALGERLAAGQDPPLHLVPADPLQIRRVIESFWFNQKKHQKILFRGLPLLAWEGEHRLRQELLRLWFVQATGNDCGPVGSLTIHPFTPVIRAVQAARGDTALALLGESLSSEAEILAARARLSDEVAQVGRELAERLGFEYPAAAEETVRQSWARFLAEREGEGE